MRSVLADPAATRLLLGSFAVSWALGGVIWRTGGISSQARHVFFGFAFMCGPAAAALWMTRRMTWEERKDALGMRRPRFDRWLALSWAIPLALIAISTLASALLPGVSLIAPSDALAAKLAEVAPASEVEELRSIPGPVLSLLLVLQAAVMGPLLNTPFMLSEELGWRGLLWSRWRALGFWRNGLATGVVWGVWHAPLILQGHNYPDIPVAGVALMIAFCILLAPPLHLVRERGGTIWHACLFHGTINAVATLGALCIVSPTWVGRGILGVAGFVTLAVACVAIRPFCRGTSS